MTGQPGLEGMFTDCWGPMKLRYAPTSEATKLAFVGAVLPMQLGEGWGWMAFDFWPQTRHALRATPHGERPTSVADFERETGRTAQDRQLDIWRKQGIEVPEVKTNGASRPRGYND